MLLVDWYCNDSPFALCSTGDQTVVAVSAQWRHRAQRSRAQQQQQAAAAARHWLTTTAFHAAQLLAV